MKKINQINKVWLIIGVNFIVILFLSFAGKNNEYFSRIFKSCHMPYKIVVFESDDWGKGISGTEFFQKMSENFSVEEFVIPLTYKKDLKWMRNSLETIEDLEMLFSTLEKHKDSRGRHPVFTANIVLTNPDFKKIKDSNFDEYFYKLPNKELLNKWKEGMARGLFYPQYHGLTHFNHARWLEILREDGKDSLTRRAFDLNIVWAPEKSLNGEKISLKGEYVDMFTTPSTAISYEKQFDIAGRGVELFQGIFGYKPESTIAPYHIWDEMTERVWNDLSIQYIQTGGYKNNALDSDGNYIKIKHFLGQKNKFGQVYLVRNCLFEPFGERNGNWKDAFREISYYFNKDIPVVIETHRGNFSSSTDKNMRDYDLNELDKLLGKIEKEFPNVIYLTSVELGQLMETGSFVDFIKGERLSLNTSIICKYKWLLKTKIIYLIILLFVGVNLFLYFILNFKIRIERKQ